MPPHSAAQLSDPVFAREVQHWREHFASLFAGSAERAPPADLAQKVEARLDGRPAPIAPVVRAGLWRPLALVSSLAAASLAAVLLIPARTPQIVQQAPQAPMIAALSHEGSSTPLAAYYDPHAKLVRMPGPMPIPAGHSAQLWAIEDGKPPVALGIFRIVGATVVADARGDAAMHPGVMLADFARAGGWFPDRKANRPGGRER